MEVLGDGLRRRTDHHDAAVVDHEYARAQSLNGGHVVADEDDRAPAFGGLLHRAEALSLKLGVADRQHLVNEQDLRLEGGRPPRTRAERTSRSNSA